MKLFSFPRVVFGAASVLLFSCSGFAQGAAARPQNAASSVTQNIVMRPSPRPPVVHPDGSVMFTLIQPNVQDVKVWIEAAESAVPMQPQPGGIWTYTTKPLKPEIYSYHYIADGYGFYDPANPEITSNLLYLDNLIVVPGSAAGLPPQPWERTDVPHGAVAHWFYHSGVVNDDRDYFVYTPPGYDPRGKKKYPVLYLQHGYSDRADSWTEVGKANFILDNLLAAGKIEPMIVVMPLGYGDPSILHTNGAAFSHPEVIGRNYDRYIQALLTEVMPRVEHDYQVKTGAKNTAIAGLSMGGAESLYTGVGHPEKFGYVIAMSAAGVEFNNPAKGLQWKAPRELLWLACGTSDSKVGEANRELDGYLKAQGVNAQFHWMDGDHTWMVWRANLVDFAPLLFRNR